MKTLGILTLASLLLLSPQAKKSDYSTTLTPVPVSGSEKFTSGTLQTLANFPSKYVAPRNVYIWLPEDYYAKPQKHAVLYMHDGQMLFDDTQTWNKQEWGMDETITKLIKANTLKSVIVVGIWNLPGMRHSEYFPEKPFQLLTPEQQDAALKTTRNNELLLKEKPKSDRYLKFIVEELKPYIDKNFATLPDQQNTYMAGSSMGGLISMYAVCEYPDVFRGAACISTHWIGAENAKNNPIPDVFVKYMSEKLPDPKTHKFYFDYGTKTLDAFYGPSQLKIDKVMKAKGYTTKSWLTKKFEGHDHSENSWKKRLSVPLTFLLKP